MGKPKWENAGQMIAGIKCGIKSYNVSDREQLVSCARELTIRKYLQLLGFRNAAAMTKIEPDEIGKYLDTLNAADIRENFIMVNEDIEDFISRNASADHIVRLYIEMGLSNVAQQIVSIANSDAAHAEQTAADIFALVHKLRSNGIVHADLKPQNLLYCLRDGAETLVLNDFDTSFVLPAGLLNKKVSNPGISVYYAAPEQFGVPAESAYVLGFATDVYSAALISYTLLNQGVHPPQYDPQSFSESLGGEYVKRIKGVFAQVRSGEICWTPPAYGSAEIKNIIVKALSVDPAKRPSAQNVLDVISSQKMAAAGTFGGMATVPADSVASVETAVGKPANNRLVLLVFACIAVIAAVTMALFLLSGKGASDDTVSPAPPVKVVRTTAAVTVTGAVTGAVTDDVGEVPTEAATVENTVTSAVQPAEKPAVTDKVSDKNEGGRNEEESKPAPETPDNGGNDTPSPPVEDKPAAEVPHFLCRNVGGGVEITGYSAGFTDSVLYIPDNIDGVSVVGIADEAFLNNRGIREIHIPDSVTYIGENAFRNNDNLETVYIGKRISSIGNFAFYADRCNYTRYYYIDTYGPGSFVVGEDCFGISDCGEYLIFYTGEIDFF